MRVRPLIGATTELCERLDDVRSSELLMTAYQRGDVAAFAELVARHEKPLWNFLRRLVRDEASAEDLLQETFMRVVKHSAQWKPSAKFSTWLYTIARNLCIDHSRRATHRRAISLDGGKDRANQRDSDPERQLHEALAGREPGGERRAMNQQFATLLDAAIAALPAPQREVFVMREVLDLPFAEIALAVGANEATVKSRMRYALESLREALAELHDEHQTPEVTR
jgi:RNA polymerase sigma-70 factor (ECF subfamily)